MTSLNFGIIGFGTIAPFYVNAMQGVDTAELVAVCTPEVARLRELAAKGFSVFSNAEEMLAVPDIDAVIVATPNALHAPMSIAALEAGKHVLCEKPMATRASDAAEMLAVAERVGKHLSVSFHNRYSPLVVEFLRQKPLSQISSFEAVFVEDIAAHSDPTNGWLFQPRLSGGGCVIDNGTNFIDVLYTVLGPLRVSTAELRRGKHNVETQARIDFAFGGSGRGSLVLDWEAKKEEKRITFTYEDGSTHTIDFLSLEDPMLPGSHMNEEYTNIIRAFGEAVRTDAPVDRQGIEVQKLVERIYEQGMIRS